jgi:gluconate 5-dehydrogenase
LGENANYVVSDLSILSAIPALVTNIESEFGKIDILVNNAGIHLKKWAQETTDEEFLKIIQTNLLSVFALTREVAKGMLERKSGSIILISSMAGLFGIDRVSAYGTSKTALIGLMNNLVTEYSRDNVRINCIAPGWITSDMFLNAINQDQERKQKIINRIALPDFGKPEDIGNAAVYLSSPAARYVTGVVLPVDGGASVNF